MILAFAIEAEDGLVDWVLEMGRVRGTRRSVRAWATRWEKTAWIQACLFLLPGGPPGVAGLLGLAMPVTLALDETDLGMMGEPIDQCRHAARVGEDVGPVAEGEVRRDDDRLVFISPRDDLEEQVRCARVVGEVADFVDA